MGGGLKNLSFGIVRDFRKMNYLGYEHSCENFMGVTFKLDYSGAILGSVLKANVQNGHIRFGMLKFQMFFFGYAW